MKKLILICITIITFVSLNSCEEENSPIFVIQPAANDIEFINSFADNYLLSDATKTNIADRFIWESVDFGAPTNVTYEVQGSIDISFSSFDVVASTSEKNIQITVAKLLEYAKTLGLDNDPLTTNLDGSANNKGQVYFRIKANAGTTNAIEVFSAIQSINITWLEETITGNTCPSLFAVGSGLTDIGWNFSADGELLCENDVLTRKLRFNKENFRFYPESGDWNVSYGYNYYINEGYTIDELLISAGDDDDNFLFDGDAGIYTMIIDNTNKTIILTPSSSLWAVGGGVPGGWNFDTVSTIEFIESTPDIWSASITLSNDAFRFFQTFDKWDANNNYTYYSEAGFTIDSSFVNDETGDANFEFVGTPGTYIMTINAIEKTITLE